MTWTNPASTPEDVALDKAWDELNRMLDRRVRVSVQMRVSACVHDLLTFITLLRRLEADELRRSDDYEARMSDWERSDKRTAPKAEWDKHSALQFASAVKATYYFVRSLQDAVYAALLEANGNRASGYSSMHQCAKNERNPLHALIVAALPDYFGWFSEVRDIRNKLKVGVSTSFNYRGVPGATQLQLVMQEIDDQRRHVSGGRAISLADIEACVVQSTRLVQWAASHVATCGPTVA